jgi:zinc protease
MLEALTFAVAGAALAALPPPELPVETRRLDNGLTVLLSEDHSLPVVAAEVRYFVGSANERPGRSGFAHLFEHLMFQGSQHYDKEYFTPFEPVGAVVNGTTNQDRTNYFERVPSNYLGLALWMEADRMGFLLPALRQDKLDNQREVVKNERRQRYENEPYGMFHTYVTAELFPKGHPYRESVIGSHADLTAASLDDVRGFFREYYTPSNAVVTVVGDVKADEAFELVKKHFGALPAGKRAADPRAALPKRTAGAHLTKTDDVKLPRVHLAWVTPALFASGDAELDLFSTVIAGSKTSRLYKPLVYDKKVAKDVTAYQASMRLGSYYVIQATAAPGVSVEVLSKELGAALRTALATPPTDDELARAQAEYRKSFYQRVEGVMSRAQLLSTYFHFTGRPDYLAEDLKRYTGATPALVGAAAQQWLVPELAVRIDVVPGAKAGGAE